VLLHLVFVFDVMPLLIQEYTAEIERLRKDLTATRDKNGVYLASDNYTQMIMQLEHQEQEISQMLANMKALKEEMDKKEASSDTLLNFFSCTALALCLLVLCGYVPFHIHLTLSLSSIIVIKQRDFSLNCPSCTN
jgi:hypothetical protein